MIASSKQFKHRLHKNERRTKRRKILPDDAKWCIENVVNLNFRKFVEKFNPIDQAIAEQRYGNLVRASFGKSDQEHLLTAFKQWKSSTECFLFWSNRKVAITQERTKRLCQEYVAKVAISEAAKLTENYDSDSSNSYSNEGGISVFENNIINDRSNASDNVLPPKWPLDSQR
ncbi:hypothetical protein G6F37_007860 [Rhizopus arrhizus]|nr:hypothetical protein G6F38_007951 [Rhizopus arrhizus]KAG1156170.1 hypothetical protein G6F37_007860 [Rhizopus arrhizus]